MNAETVLTDLELIKIIAEKIGHDYEESFEVIDTKVGYYLNNENHVIQLYINNCNLMTETIPEEVWELTHLQTLYLSSNMIAIFPLGLLKLKNLVHLHMNGNALRRVPGRICELCSLESLDLAGNKLETLPPEIGGMTSLKKLRLNTNGIISLPVLNPEKDWLSLEAIDLDGADMKELPSWIFSLHSLKSLSLSNLKFNRFPELISHLSRLEQLYIDSTEFPFWPERIVLPNSMRFIVLDGSHLPKVKNERICRIPEAIIELKPRYVRNQRSIDRDDKSFQVSLGGNISMGLDEKLLFHQDPQVSYTYLKNLYSTDADTKKEDVKYIRLKDFKVVLLGAGAVGKSSLVQRLYLPNPDDDNIALETVETTPGVNIDYQLELKEVWDETNNRYESFVAHFWDFGGQDKYRGINKLLLTDNAIYIIVLDSRAQTMPDIWLEMVKRYAPNSQIILVANKIDENPRLNINFKYYCEKYPQLYNCLFKISCKYPSLGINRISDIIDAIKRILSQQMNQIVPIGQSRYIEIQTEVEKHYRIRGKALLSQEEYSVLCASHGLTDRADQDRLLSMLNTCGSCIAIEDEEYSIVNPNWIAKYLYLFYENLGQSKAIMDYKKEYVPLLQSLKEYAPYRELLTDYLVQRGLCSVFYDNNNCKKIFIPMFLPEDDIVTKKGDVPLKKSTLKYKFISAVIPEYEYQKLLTITFSQICKSDWSAWQFGFSFEYCGSRIYIQLVNNGLQLDIWSRNNADCGESFKWLRHYILSVADREFFTECIIIQKEKQQALLPYATLEALNSWGIPFYGIPAQDNEGVFVLINIEDLCGKCGITYGPPEVALPDEIESFKKFVANRGLIMKINMNVEKWDGNINHYETHGNDSPIIISNKEADLELMGFIADIKEKIDLIGEEFDDLKELLNQLENSDADSRPTIKAKLSRWVEQSARLLAIGDILYSNKEAIISGVEDLLSLI